MELLVKILVCFAAGAGAGLGTGFAGMSAAAVVGPMLITFLDMPAYLAVGVALASDVLASAVSAWTYRKNGNLDLKNGLVMMAFVLLFTTVGSFAASRLPNSTMGSFSVFMTLLLGMEAVPAGKRLRRAVLGGAGIGFICGFVGAGGGMMMLLVLTSLLGYELKCAVGTSVFIMVFTALTGAVSHFSIGGLPDLTVLALCMLFTLIWARIASVIANRADAITLNRATGAVLVTLGAVILGVGFLRG